MKLQPDFLDHLMSQALAEAKQAFQQGEVPVGAVIAREDKIIAQAHNEMEATQDATRHAEMLAIHRAAQKTGSWRLLNTVLCVTLEPCTMCAGAIKLARVPVVVYGAADEKMGAFGSLYDLSQDQRIGPVPRVITGVSEAECSTLLKEFFASKRKKKIDDG